MGSVCFSSYSLTSYSLSLALALAGSERLSLEVDVKR